MAKTLRERFIAGLEQYGYKPFETKSNKYIVMRKASASPAFFFVGKAGALRFSSVCRVDMTVAANEATRAKILYKGDQK